MGSYLGGGGGLPIVMSTPICAMACDDTKVLALITTSATAKKIRFMLVTF